MFKQDLEIDDSIQIYIIHLLFKEKPVWPSQDSIIEALESKFELDIIGDTEGMVTVSLKNHTVDYDDQKKVPMMLMVAYDNKIEHSIGDGIDRSQFWNVEDGERQLDECQYQVVLSDMMASGLDPIERANVLMDFLEVMHPLFPTCDLVYYNSSRKLLTYESSINNPYENERRILWGGCNARFFNIEGTEDCIVDTIGLNILDTSDIQYHFKNSVDVNDVIYHAYNTAIYQFENRMPIENNETIAGFNNEHWICQYEDSLIQPKRSVLDINMLELAAGVRK